MTEMRLVAAIAFWEERTLRMGSDGYDFCGYDYKVDELREELSRLEDEAVYRVVNGCL